ncbi:MAG: hypothetical protein IJS13_06055 [Paludibacteraceae bacterium]|nr:hypothetical protein [Paludibacteraceae bacterium]
MKTSSIKTAILIGLIFLIVFQFLMYSFSFILGGTPYIKHKIHKMLVCELKEIIPHIDNDSLLMNEYMGLQWYIYSRTEPIQSIDIPLNNRKVISYIIRKEEFALYPEELAVVEDKVYLNVPLIIHKPHSPHKKTEMNNKTIERMVIESKELCKSLILNNDSNMHFVGVSWLKNDKLWELSDSSSQHFSKYTCDFYLLFYYKLWLYQLVYVNDETKNKMLEDDVYTHIWSNWFLRPYMWKL